MNSAIRKENYLLRLTLVSMLLVALCTLGCASAPTGSISSRSAHSYRVPNNKIFIGNETITVRGMPMSRARELDRYTCGDRGVMVCQAMASLAQCACYRK